MGDSVSLLDVCSELVDCVNRTAPETAGGGYYAVGTPAMRGNHIDFSQAREIAAETFCHWTRRLTPQEGDLFIAREAPVGPVVRVPAGGNIAAGQRTMHLRPDPSAVHPRFLFYLLISSEVQSRISIFSMGSTVAHLRVADVKSLPLPPLPSLSTQRSIADVLGALDDKIAANDEIAKTIDELVSARYFKLRSGVNQGPLSDIASINSSLARPAPKGSLRYVDIASVSVGAYEFPDLIGWDAAPGRARRPLRFGDTIWSTVRPSRRSHALVLDDDNQLIGSTGLAVLTPIPGRTAGLFESTRTPEFTAYLESVAEGSAYPAVRADKFLSAPVPALSAVEWDEFENVALPLRKRGHAAVKENRSLAATREKLLPLLMSGKIRVRDAEKVVEGVV